MQVWSVEIDSHRYPVVQALEVASGVPRVETWSACASEVLAKLGFEPTFDRPALRPDDNLANGTLPTMTSEAKSGDAQGLAELSWTSMDSQPRASVVRVGKVPRSYGVYAFYRTALART